MQLIILNTIPSSIDCFQKCVNSALQVYLEVKKKILEETHGFENPCIIQYRCTPKKTLNIVNFSIKFFKFLIFGIFAYYISTRKIETSNIS